jgi:hypothetical protein
MNIDPFLNVVSQVKMRIVEEIVGCLCRLRVAGK